MQCSWALLLFSLVALTCGLNYDPHRFKNFLLQNRMKQCEGMPPVSRFLITLPATTLTASPLMKGKAKAPERVPACNNEMVNPPELDEYTFQTERWISTIGLNIYDGATWAMAVALLGEQDTAREYQQGINLGGSTCQFKDIRGDSPCKGVIVEGQCSDPNQAGVCGFCYGESASQPFENAWSFRSISDYWSLQGTVDARCPQLGHTWIWNDYKPVLGENAWANLIAPLQVALLKFGTIQAIPADDLSLKIALNFFQSLHTAVNQQVGGLYYSPKNTLGNPTTDLGFNLSIENNASLLSGLKALQRVLQVKNLHTELLPQIASLIAGVESFLKAAYSPQLGFFRQGGTVVNGQFQWNNDFAVDCQTWLMSVVGPNTVNAWFGNGTAQAVWATTKKIGGYHYTPWSGSVDGLGFSDNSDAQCFSGEWTAGGVNMLRIFANELGDKSFAKEADDIRQNIEYTLTETQTIDGVECRAVKYANKRYYIPFGWWANPLDSLASTTWSAFLDANWNPFHLGGAYNSTY